MPDNYLMDDEELDYLDTFGDGDGSPDTPFGSHSSMADMLSTVAPPNLKAQNALASMRPMPIQGKPKLWQRIAAGAVGGAAGLVNASGRTHVNPSGAINAIYEGNTPYEQDKWAQERQQLGQAAEMERQQNIQENAGYRTQAAQQVANARMTEAQARARREEAIANRPPAPVSVGDGRVYLPGTNKFEGTPRPTAPNKAKPGDFVQDPETQEWKALPGAPPKSNLTGEIAALEDPNVSEATKDLIRAKYRKQAMPPRGPAEENPEKERRRNLRDIETRKSSGYTSLKRDLAREIEVIGRDYDGPNGLIAKASGKDKQNNLRVERDEKINAAKRSDIQRKNDLEEEIGSMRQSRDMGGVGGYYDETTGEWVKAGGGLTPPDAIDAAPAAKSPKTITQAEFDAAVQSAYAGDRNAARREALAEGYDLSKIR